MTMNVLTKLWRFWLSRSDRRTKSGRRTRGFRLCLEPLETRLTPSDGTGAGTALVLDINPGSTGSDLRSLTDVNGTLFFSANDSAHGPELWKSNGAGTVLVKDINPGAGGSYFQNLTNVNGTLFFAADDGTHGRELWKSDGTTAGTVLVKDIYPGTNDYGFPFGSFPSRLTNVNGTLFFVADDGNHGSEVCKSDGSPTGSPLVKDIYKGHFSSSSQDLTNVNGTLFFSANDGTHGGDELWKSDGSATGTVLV